MGSRRLLYSFVDSILRKRRGLFWRGLFFGSPPHLPSPYPRGLAGSCWISVHTELAVTTPETGTAGAGRGEISERSSQQGGWWRWAVNWAVRSQSYVLGSRLYRYVSAPSGAPILTALRLPLRSRPHRLWACSSEGCPTACVGGPKGFSGRDQCMTGAKKSWETSCCRAAAATLAMSRLLFSGASGQRPVMPEHWVALRLLQTQVGSKQRGERQGKGGALGRDCPRCWLCSVTWG